MGFTVDIKGNAAHLYKTLKGVESSLRSVGNFASYAIKPMAGIGAVGVTAMTAFVVSSSKAAADIEDLSIQFEVLTGSAKKATELIAQFREEEKKSALSAQDYAEAAKLLLANNVAYEDLLPTLRMIGDVSMGNSERFGRVALALGQISSKTKLAANETNQLAESGFNPLQQMIKMTGEAYSDLLKKQEAGQISFKDVAEAMKFATSEGGLFYKAIEKGSAGTNAKINQLRASVTQLQVAFGTGFNKGLKDALDASNNFLPQLEDKFTKFGDIVGSSISEATQGNTEELALIGGLIGEVLWAGVKATFQKGLDSMISDLVPSVMEGMSQLTDERSGAALKTLASGYRGVVGESSPLSGYIQKVIEESEESGSLAGLLRLQKARQERDSKSFMKQYEESNKWLEGIYKNQSIVGAKFSN